MPQKSYDILAVGNAIIDVFSQCDDDFLLQHAIEKGEHGSVMLPTRMGGTALSKCGKR